MLKLKQPGVAVVTTTEAKRDLPGTFRVAEKMRVYVTKDGQPIGGLVSMDMMELLERAVVDEAERAARRKNITVRVVRRVAEPSGDNEHMTPAQGIDLMRTLSRSTHAIREAAKRAGA